jgi:4-amino-4-deoxy-L-arabinose transferase-like glycosyltransferase
MATPPRLGLTGSLLFLLIVAVAAATRAGYLLTLANAGWSDGPLQVQDASPNVALDVEIRGRNPPTELDTLVQNLREHRWFGTLAPLAGREEATAHEAPGYAWLLGLAGRVFDDPERVAWCARWAQVALGALTAGLYFLFVRRAFGFPLVATIAGLFAALHPFWIIATAELNDGVLAAFQLALVLVLGARAGQEGGAVSSLLYGLALAGLALIRAAFLPFAFVAVLWFLLRCRRLDRGWLCALLACLGFANGLLPWSLRNALVFREATPLVDSTWLHLWMGNNPRADGGPLSEAVLLEALAEQRGVSVESLREELERLPQNRRYESLAPDVIAVIRLDPARCIQHRFEAGISFLLGEAWLRERRLDALVPGTELPSWLATWHSTILGGTLLAMFLLAALGWRWSYVWQRGARPLALALVWIPLPYLLSHAGVLHGPRLPFDGVLLSYAAFGFVALIPGFGRNVMLGEDWNEDESD